MMRLIIVCEGETEREFCRDVLEPYFRRFHISVHPPLIKQTRGGIVKWDSLKRQIENHLKQDRSAYVTTFVDLYGIRAEHSFPGFTNIGSDTSASRIDQMQLAMHAEIDENLRHRFIAYIQQHEFEALIFSETDVIRRNFSDAELSDTLELERISLQYPNPEDINDSPITAPSKRLQRIIPGYQKVVYGSMLTEEIGMVRMLSCCPRFKAWITRLCSIQNWPR